MLKLKNTPAPQYLHVLDLQDGQIAVVQQCGECEYKGRVVQRYEDSLLTLGATSGSSWPGLFLNCSDKKRKQLNDFRVEVLEPGTEFIL